MSSAISQWLGSGEWIRDPDDTDTGHLFDDVDGRRSHRAPRWRHAAKPGRHARRPHPATYPLIMLATVTVATMIIGASFTGSDSGAAGPHRIRTGTGTAPPVYVEPEPARSGEDERADRTDARPEPVAGTQTAPDTEPVPAGTAAADRPRTAPTERRERRPRGTAPTSPPCPPPSEPAPTPEPSTPTDPPSQPPSEAPSPPEGTENPSEPPADGPPPEVGTPGDPEPVAPSQDATEPVTSSPDTTPSEGTNG